jgi:hypothetical protein
VTFIIGRGQEELAKKPAGKLGTFRALDGSEGAPLYFDCNGPHAMLVVGKRGYGKSYTMGVIAEALARTEEIAPIVIDPMGVFESLTEPSVGESIPAKLISEPRVSPDAVDPRSWCSMLGLAPETGPGGLVWQAAQEESTMEGMRHHVEDARAASENQRAAINHLALAESWDVFDADGLDATTLGGSEATVIDISGFDAAPMNAVARGVAEGVYRARIDQEISRLPWLLIDEAHTFFDGVADRALRRILTRGRAPGVSIVLATQRPGAVSEAGISQSDVLIAHRLTSIEDIEALEAAQPTYMTAYLDERLPEAPGDVLIVDDSTETVHAAQIRERSTPHGGESPAATEIDQL